MDPFVIRVGEGPLQEIPGSYPLSAGRVSRPTTIPHAAGPSAFRGGQGVDAGGGSRRGRGGRFAGCLSGFVEGTPLGVEYVVLASRGI